MILLNFTEMRKGYQAIKCCKHPEAERDAALSQIDICIQGAKWLALNKMGSRNILLRP